MKGVVPTHNNITLQYHMHIWHAFPEAATESDVLPDS